MAARGAVVEEFGFILYIIFYVAGHVAFFAIDICIFTHFEALYVYRMY